MKFILAINMLIMMILMAACVKKGIPSAAPQEEAVDMHASRISLDWIGTYTGVIPAASGPGIEVTLKLTAEETYVINYHYIDRSNDIFKDEGRFSWNVEGNEIILDSENFPKYYRIGENRITQLDLEGNPITGMSAENYVLVKEQEIP
ncbi:MAG: copper resistance protein NlpE [Spirochaetaceae bacterium]|nr:copper resistance protein NlpE [Spirochaetaceae bacterium]